MKILLLTLTLLTPIIHAETKGEKLTALRELYDKAIARGEDKERLDKILITEIIKIEKEFEEPVEEFNIRKFKIDAHSTGERIGSFVEGEVITIQYIAGSWRGDPSFRWESPDNASNGRHAIVLSKRGVDHLDEDIEKPKNTKEEPMRIVIEKTGNYYLRINAPILSGNEGVVEYEVGTLKK